MIAHDEAGAFEQADPIVDGNRALAQGGIGRHGNASGDALTIDANI